MCKGGLFFRHKCYMTLGKSYIIHSFGGCAWQQKKAKCYGTILKLFFFRNLEI
jgi:hypothetical protein